MKIISLGAGVQSTTLLLMSLRGDLPKADCAVFADTGCEPAATYEYLDYLETQCQEAGTPLYRVSGGDLLNDLQGKTPGRTRTASVPAYTRNLDGKSGILRRQCTNEYKLGPLRKKERELLGLKPGARSKGAVLERWIGISLDEASRMKDSQDAWAVNVYPLIDLRMSRHDCLQWLRRSGYPAPPKSACIICPFHSNAFWRDMKDNRPGEWAQAVAADESIRHGLHKVTCEGILHKSLIPLKMADLSTAEDHGQMRIMDSFENECQGMCGL